MRSLEYHADRHLGIRLIRVQPAGHLLRVRENLGLVAPAADAPDLRVIPVPDDRKTPSLRGRPFGDPVDPAHQRAGRVDDPGGPGFQRLVYGTADTVGADHDPLPFRQAESLVDDGHPGTFQFPDRVPVMDQLAEAEARPLRERFPRDADRTLHAEAVSGAPGKDIPGHTVSFSAWIRSIRSCASGSYSAWLALSIV